MTDEKEKLARVFREKELVIFDFDGTLLDSMEMWGHIGTDYIKAQGITPPADLEERLVSMTLEQSGEFYRKELGLKKTVEEYMADLLNFVGDRYANQLSLKPGAKEFVRKTAEFGKKRCILTTTIRSCVEGAMKSHGLDRWIHKLYTCNELHMTKTSPEVYRYVAGQMGASVEKTIVFEDAPFAVKNAKLAGCTVVGVYDAFSADGQDTVERYADFRIRDFSDILRNR